jgi:NAD(P)-dependent dehydrogenase (short-subunit alcohol dehydrogenase family)
VTDPDSVRAAFDKVVEAFGGVIVVSNAGAAWQGNIGTVDDEVLRKSFSSTSSLIKAWRERRAHHEAAEHLWLPLFNTSKRR